MELLLNQCRDQSHAISGVHGASADIIRTPILGVMFTAMLCHLRHVVDPIPMTHLTVLNTSAATEALPHLAARATLQEEVLMPLSYWMPTTMVTRSGHSVRTQKRRQKSAFALGL